MPHKKGVIGWPSWVENIESSDPCLATIVREALVAQDAALRAGVNPSSQRDACSRAYRSAEQTLDNIRLGRIGGDAAWKRGSDALRKFTAALECAAPTIRR